MALIVSGWNITPTYDVNYRNYLKSYRKSIPYLSTYRHAEASTTSCGIIWTLATVNGSSTDFNKLSRENSGEGSYRLLSVVYEVLVSAARIRHALSMNHRMPPHCGDAPPELTLFMDRNILDFGNTSEARIRRDVYCTFDRIIYYDDLPQIENIVKMKTANLTNGAKSRLGTMARLSPRTNVLKLVALLSSPYKYTLYLDGDTAPCKGFQYESFDRLKYFDLVTSANPFGYQSTNGEKLYEGAPPHPDFANFPEINGGIIGFKWSANTELFLVRTLELVPFFSTLGFDQDQAFMRHALFEMRHKSNITHLPQPMKKYCRFGWECRRNSCDAGCLIIHQRKCNYMGIDHKYPVPKSDSQCTDSVKLLERRMSMFTARYFKAMKLNKSRSSRRGARRPSGGQVKAHPRQANLPV